MLKNKHNLIILLLGLVFVLSGCFKKEVKPMVENIKPSPVVNVENANNEKVDETTAEKLDEIFTTPIEEWSKEVWPPKEMVEKFDYTGWKTYVNEELKYSIKYPPDWGVGEYDYAPINGINYKADLVEIVPPKPEDFTNYISIMVQDRNEIVSKRVVYKGNDELEIKTIFINYKAYQYKHINNTPYRNNDMRFVNFVFTNKDNSEILEIDTDQYDTKEAPQIMASFKFID